MKAINGRTNTFVDLPLKLKSGSRWSLPSVAAIANHLLDFFFLTFEDFIFVIVKPLTAEATIY